MPQCETANLVVSPNPGNGIIQVELKDENGEYLSEVSGSITLKDISGESFLSTYLDQPQFEFDAFSLQEGLYYLIFTGTEGTVIHSTFIKN